MSLRAPQRASVPWGAAVVTACLACHASSPAGVPFSVLACRRSPAFYLRLRGGAIPEANWNTALLEASAHGARNDLSLEDASAAFKQHGLSVSVAQVRELLRLSGAAGLECVQAAQFSAALAAHPPTSALGRWQQVRLRSPDARARTRLMMTAVAPFGVHSRPALVSVGSNDDNYIIIYRKHGSRQRVPTRWSCRLQVWRHGMPATSGCEMTMAARLPIQASLRLHK